MYIKIIPVFLLNCWLIFFASACKGDGSDRASKPQQEETGAKTITVYTHRFYEADKALFEQFRELSNIELKVVRATTDELIARLLEEGKQTPMDVLLLDAVVGVEELKSAGILQPFSSQTLDSHVPFKYRDPDGYWIGLSHSPVGFVYAADKVNREELDNYADLAKGKWKGNVLVSRASEAANLSLMASMIKFESLAKAQSWSEGVRANLARAPLPRDFDQFPSITSGAGLVGLVDLASFIQFQRSGNPESFRISEGLNFIFPKNPDGATYYRMEVGAMSKETPDRQAVIQFLEFLTGKSGQNLFPQTLFEYPVNPMVIPSEFLIEHGGYQGPAGPVGVSVEQLQSAREIFEASGWNDGIRE